MLDEDYDLSMAMKPCSPCDYIDWLVSAIWPLLLIVGYAIADTHVFHWFVIPVYFCGILISPDAVHWCRGKMDTFDPRGLVGLLGCNFFVISPILVAYYKIDQVAQIPFYVDDMRKWLGWTASLNLFGIMLYKYIERKVSRKPVAVKKYWLDNVARSLGDWQALLAWVRLLLSAVLCLLCY
jgi:hypothetical protein